jgi:hypothetical protein
MAQAVEYLPRKHKALNSTYNTPYHKQNDISSTSYSIYKNQLKIHKRHKSKTRRKHREKLLNTGLGKTFWVSHQKSHHKEKNEQMGKYQTSAQQRQQ